MLKIKVIEKSKKIKSSKPSTKSKSGVDPNVLWPVFLKNKNFCDISIYSDYNINKMLCLVLKKFHYFGYEEFIKRLFI